MISDRYKYLLFALVLITKPYSINILNREGDDFITETKLLKKNPNIDSVDIMNKVISSSILMPSTSI